MYSWLAVQMVGTHKDDDFPTDVNSQLDDESSLDDSVISSQ